MAESIPTGRRTPKKLRLTRSDDISGVFERGRRVADGVLTLLVLRNDLAVPRLGVAVSTRHGKAVRRNRIKRLCREAFRLVRDQLPAGWDYMLVPRASVEFTLVKLQKSILSLAPRAIEAASRKGGV